MSSRLRPIHSVHVDIARFSHEIYQARAKGCLEEWVLSLVECLAVRDPNIHPYGAELLAEVGEYRAAEADRKDKKRREEEARRAAERALLFPAETGGNHFRRKPEETGGNNRSFPAETGGIHRNPADSADSPPRTEQSRTEHSEPGEYLKGKKGRSSSPTKVSIGTGGRPTVLNFSDGSVQVGDFVYESIEDYESILKIREVVSTPNIKANILGRSAPMPESDP